MIDAGPVLGWVHELRAALRGERAAAVPCGDCSACCTSSQFVHIEPDEHEALAHIPSELLFPAPRLPQGHVLLGYDAHGRCPMLVDGRCSIYEHRPRTCRAYDCRVFAAAGVEPDGDARVAIRRRVDQWRFSTPTEPDAAALSAVRRAAGWLRAHVAELGSGAALALAAIDVHELFLDERVPALDELRAHLAARRSA